MFYPKTDFCPFNSDEPYWPSDENCVECPVDMNNQKKNNMENAPMHDTQCEMMKKIQETEFAMIDLNLFLDTHPDCSEALKLYSKLGATLKSLKSDYQARFGPLYACESSSQTPFQWVEDGRKWPWEN